MYSVTIWLILSDFKKVDLVPFHFLHFYCIYFQAIRVTEQSMQGMQSLQSSGKT